MEMNPVIEHSWSGISLPRDIEVLRADEKHGAFAIEPLVAGYGTFVGNALRRVLLSSLHGAAIVLISIPQVTHEFSSVSGMIEDVTALILNLKQVRFRYHGDQAIRLTLKVTAEPGEGSFYVRAGDIDTTPEGGGAPRITVLNPELHIATLSRKPRAPVTFEMTLWVDSSYGYASPEDHKLKYYHAQDGSRSVSFGIDAKTGARCEVVPPSSEHEYIPIDSIYRPISRVNFRVRPTQSSGAARAERLELEIDGDGSVTPREALALSAKILKEQMSVFALFREEEGEPTYEAPVDQEQSFNENLYRQVDELELSVRSSNCLKSANITYIGELVQKTGAEMLKTKNFGRKSLRELEEVLGSMNLQLGMKIDGWSPDNAPKKK
jgi:DNA-directed RNA polymerase subunit alpha